MKKALSSFIVFVFIFTLVFAVTVQSVQAASLSAPKNPKATAVNSTSIKLTWSSVKGAKTYEIHQYNTTSKKYVKIASTKSKTYTNKKLKAGTTYKYKICAVNGKKKGAFSKVVPCITKPGAPTGLVVTNTTNNSIAFKWSKTTGATKYKIYMATSKTGSYKLKTTTAKTSYTATKLTKNKTYYFKVSASNTSGEGLKTNYISANTVITKPKIVTNLTAKTLSDSGISLKWDPPPGATKYMIYSSLSPQTGYVYLGTINGPKVTITNCRSNTLYYFKVSAANSAGTGPLSKYASAKTFIGILSAPTNLRITNVENNKIDLAWDPVGGAKEYYVYCTEHLYEDFHYKGKTSGTSFTANGLRDDTIYYFIATTVSESGEGPGSTITSAQTLSLEKIKSNLRDIISLKTSIVQGQLDAAQATLNDLIRRGFGDSSLADEVKQKIADCNLKLNTLRDLLSAVNSATTLKQLNDLSDQIDAVSTS